MGKLARDGLNTYSTESDSCILPLVDHQGGRPNYISKVPSQLIYTCSKSTIETPEKSVKYVQS